jgi:hypothetical protein
VLALGAARGSAGPVFDACHLHQTPLG